MISGVAKLEGFVSVKETAGILGVSARSVYGYIEAGKLKATYIGASLAVHIEDVRAYQKVAAGRPRRHTPPWHVPSAQNLSYLTTIHVRLREGQEERLVERLAEIRASGKHLLPGTVARYIMRSDDHPDMILVMLVWRQSLMPLAEEREAALAALGTELADLLIWEEATSSEGLVVLNT